MTPRLSTWLDAQRGKQAAVVLGASCNGLSFVRSLARRGIPTLLLDSDDGVGMRTRFGASARMPSARDQEVSCLAFLEHVGSRLGGRPCLLATTDVHVLLIARNAPLLAPRFRFLVPEASIVEHILDKRLQYEFASSVGIPLPDVFYPSSVDDARRLGRLVSYPCILKPHDSGASRAALRGRKLAVVADLDELVEEYARLSQMGVPLMIQELVPGPDTALFGYLGLWDERGEIAWVTKQKLRQYPPGFGDGSLTVTASAPRVLAKSRRLLRELGYVGFVGVEFKQDRRDGTFRLMEVNPRTVSANEVAIRAGVDFPWLGYTLLTTTPVRPRPVPVEGRMGVKHVNEPWDAGAFNALRQRGDLTLAAWLRSLRDVRAFAIWAADDPWPLLATMVGGARARVSRGTGIVVTSRRLKAGAAGALARLVRR